MIRLIFLLVFLSLGSLTAQDFRSLLSDAALSGWHVIVQEKGVVPNDQQNYFRWEGEQLHVYPEALNGRPQPFAALVTDSVYANYHFQLEYRWGENKFPPRDSFVRDAGILFHVFDTEPFWASGLECQIQEGDTGDIWLVGCRAGSTVQNVIRNYASGGTYVSRGGGNARFARFHRSYSWEKPGWNQVDVVVKEDSARFYVNGHLVNALSDAAYPGGEKEEWLSLDRGQILLQAEGAELYYRNVVIRSLP